MMHVKVFLSPAAFGLPGDAMEAITLSIEADDPFDACEIAFAICNSYPNEMHCGSEHLPSVRVYRTRKHRSMMAGDYVTVDGRRFNCDRVGWIAASA